MTKTVILLALPALMTGCVDPERYDGSEPMVGADTGNETGASDDDIEGSEDDTGGPAEETGSGEGDGESGGGDETTGPQETACDPATHECVDPVPAGWNGPIRTKDPSAEAGCGAGWDTEEYTVFDSVSAAPSACSCECGAPSGGSCDNLTDGEEYGNAFGANADDCDVPTESFILGAQWLSPVGGNGVAWVRRWIVQPPDVSDAGECSPDASSYSETFYPISRAAQREICGTAETDDDACPGDGLCVPQGDSRFEAGVCIWQAGDVECPEGEFTERTVAFTDVMDSRECGTCACGTAVGESCADASVRVLATGGTPNSQYEFPADGTCQDVMDQQGAEFDLEYIRSLHLEPGEPSGGACEGMREAYGDVEAVDPVTICCTAE